MNFQPRFILEKEIPIAKNIEMNFLTKEDIISHLKTEVIDFITESNDDIINEAIDAGIEEVKGYLTDYDIVSLFTASGTDRNPIILLYTKDVTVWHFINLANPNIEVAFREMRYRLAIEWLEKVQSRKTNPVLPPRPVTPGSSPLSWEGLRAGSNPPRRSGY